jgi:hypothetical protein
VRLVLVLVCALACAVPAAADARPLLGVRGNAARFQALTGQRPEVGHAFIGWGQGASWGSPFSRLFATLGKVPLVSLTMGRGWPDTREAITPRALALGRGDGFLVALNRAIAAWGRPFYLRPFPEMNGHWNSYCAYDKSGRRRDAAHSTRMFRKAFARVYVIAHGGSEADVNARLRRLGLPPVRAELAANPPPTLKVVWNPQGFGSPDLPGNAADAYYPGDAYVDVVGDNLYNRGGTAAWAAAERLYRAHPHKPFAFGEWGTWGIDDPRFVRRMARFARTHRRLELLVWFDARRGSIWDLGDKPRSRAAYRRLITSLQAP